MQLISPSLLSSKSTVNECWIAYDGVVYDVTRWLPLHPGGFRSIMSAAGQDATSVMKSLHSPYTLKRYIGRMKRVGILEKSMDYISNDYVDPQFDPAHDRGKVEEDDDDDLTNNGVKIQTDLMQKVLSDKRAESIQNDFHKLNEQLLKDGWFDPKPSYYWGQISRILLFIIVGVKLILHSRSLSGIAGTTALGFGSMLVGLFFQNLAFMGHDAGHGSITGNAKLDVWIGIFIGNLFTGIDITWWKSTHYTHHSATNSMHDDPDIQHMPLMCFEERMAEGRWSTYHGKWFLFDAITRSIVKYQHLYFYPVMGVARVNLYIQSFIFLFKTCPFLPDSDKGKKVMNEETGEIKEKYAWPKATNFQWFLSVITLVMFYLLMYALLSSLTLPSAVACFVVSHVTAGILHVQILLSHAGMHYCEDGSGGTGTVTNPSGCLQAGYYEWQALSTMDISCPVYMDWFHGGLQFQLEHHLFPRVPRWNLRKLMPLVDELFGKYDIPVVRKSFFDANLFVCNHLAEVGEKVCKLKVQ